MHVEIFSPEINKVYFITKYTLIHIISGKRSIQVDFKNYYNWRKKAIFLEKGQYIKFLSEEFLVRRIEFSNETKLCNNETRVLFKHLVSLGYIDLLKGKGCNTFLSESVLTDNSTDILDVSSQQWYWQNPFKASKDEYQVIFDTKEIIDKEYSNRLTSNEIVSSINDRGYNIQSLIKNKIGVSIKNLVNSKRFKEGLKEIAFTDKSIQEISYELGFKDDAYFNRIYKNATGQTPKQYRENFDFKNRDLFTQDIIGLIQTYHAQERSLAFYANKMNLSISSLSNKVKTKMDTPFGKLVRLELINTAKLMILEGESISSIARQLGFEESNHFSKFFKRHSGNTPTDFKLKN